MVEQIKSIFDRVYILWGVVIVLVGWIYYIATWKSDLESRVHILEVRGSPHLEAINSRLTVTEKETQSNNARIDRIVEIMLRELPIKGQDLRPPFHRGDVMGIVDESGKAVSAVTESLKGTPVVLSLMILVFGTLVFAAYLIGLGVGSARDRDKMQWDLIQKLVTDIRDCRGGEHPK